MSDNEFKNGLIKNMEGIAYWQRKTAKELAEIKELLNEEINK